MPFRQRVVYNPPTAMPSSFLTYHTIETLKNSIDFSTIMNNTAHLYPKALLVLVWTSLLIGCGKSENAYVAPPPPEVTVSAPAIAMVTPFLEKNGVIEAVEAADVRARVRGFVQEIKFDPGQNVKQGDPLYLIEPDTYQASVNSAQAAVKAAEAAESVAKSAVKVAEAESKRAKRDLARETTLMEKNAGSQAALDAATATNDVAAASIESAKANLEAAAADKGKAIANLAQVQLDLDYTTVRSPIDGRISPTDVKVGNLVENGGHLASVVNRDEVFVNFSISDREMLEFMKKERDRLNEDAEYKEPDWSEFEVYLGRELDEGFPFVGVMDYVDQEGIDASTGTLRMRSRHDNPKDQLFPGLFVTVRVPSSKKAEQMLVPEYAVLRDQRGRYVLVIGADNKVQRLSITPGQTISGWTVIDDGVTRETKVVVDGIQSARPGLEVAPVAKPLKIDGETLLRGFSPTDSSSTEAEAVDEPAPSENE